MTDDDLDPTFDRLDAALPDAPWRAPDTIRRVAGRRRFTRRALVVAATAVVAGGVLVAALSTKSPTHTVQASGGGAQQLVANVKPLATRDDGAAKALVAAEQQFAIDLLKHTNSTDNSVLSPASLAIALAMLQTGARGTTEAEIAKVLHTSGLSAAEQDAGWAALVDDLASAKGVTVQSANSLWLQKKLPMEQAYLDVLARYFRTGVWQVDFANDLPGAEKAINAWTSDKTHGKITKLFAPGALTQDTALVLANAIYFKAAWQTEFDPKLTRPATFTKGDGSTEQVPFMAALAKVSDRVTDKFQSVQIPYAGGRYSALVVMPTRGSLKSFVAGLTPDQITEFAATTVDSEARLELPTFTLNTYADLTDTMQVMGIHAAFGGGFSAMSPVPLAVQSIVQRDFLKVDEHGTEAAAVTGIAMQTSSTRGVQLRPFDHPFLFLVRDTKTGAILFTAQVNDPSA